MQRAEENFKDTIINSFREEEMIAKMTNAIGGLENKIGKNGKFDNKKTKRLALKEKIIRKDENQSRDPD